MIQIFLTIPAVVSALCYGVYSIVKERSLPVFALAGALFFTAVLELSDLMAVFHPSDLYFWKKFAVMSEGFLPVAWMVFSLSYARRYDIHSISWWQVLFLVLSPLFLIVSLVVPTS